MKHKFIGNSSGSQKSCRISSVLALADVIFMQGEDAVGLGASIQTKFHVRKDWSGIDSDSSYVQRFESAMLRSKSIRPDKPNSRSASEALRSLDTCDLVDKTLLLGFQGLCKSRRNKCDILTYDSMKLPLFNFFLP